MQPFSLATTKLAGVKQYMPQQYIDFRVLDLSDEIYMACLNGGENKLAHSGLFLPLHSIPSDEDFPGWRPIHLPISA